MRSRSALSTLAIGCALVVAACSGGDDDTTSTTEPSDGTAAAGVDDETDAIEDEPASQNAAEVEPIDDDLASAMWTFNDVALETGELWRGADADGRLRGWQLLPGTPAVAVADNADGHVAFVSDDLINFRPVHRGCCGFTLADRLGDRIAIASVSPTVTTVFASPDGGATWTTHEIAPLGGTPDNPFLLTDLIVTDGGYMATAAPNLGGALPPGAVYTTTDLTTWTTVALPGLDPALSPNSTIELFRGGTGELWIVALTTPGSTSRYVPFRSGDGGLTIEPQPELRAPATAVAAVADRLVIWPATDDLGSHPWILVPGAGWARAPADVDQWGVDGVRVWSWAVDPESGRVVVAIERLSGEVPDGCDPVEVVCELRAAVVTSPDGLVWADVDTPSADPDSPGSLGATGVGPVPAATGRDGWLIWEPEADSDGITAYRWTGPAPIPTIEPPDAPSPGPTPTTAPDG